MRTLSLPVSVLDDEERFFVIDPQYRRRDNVMEFTSQIREVGRDEYSSMLPDLKPVLEKNDAP